MSSRVSVVSSASVWEGSLIFLCLKQLLQAEPPVQEENKSSLPRSLGTPHGGNFEESVPRNSAHRRKAPATAFLIQEVRWGWGGAADHTKGWPVTVCHGERVTNSRGPQKAILLGRSAQSPLLPTGSGSRTTRLLSSRC